MPMKLSENLNQKNDIENVMKKSVSDLSKLEKKILRENKDKNLEVFNLKDYKIKDYWSYFSIDINDLYWLTVKKVEWEIVFDAKHEWFISKEYMDLAVEETIDNWNIDMINRYLKGIDRKLITDESDIKVLNNLFEKMDKTSE